MLAIQKLKFTIPMKLLREWSDAKLVDEAITTDERKTYEALVVATVATAEDTVSLSVAQLVDLGVGIETAKGSVVQPDLFESLEDGAAPANN